jgi:hypothetical protein
VAYSLFDDASNKLGRLLGLRPAESAEPPGHEGLQAAAGE